MSTLFPQDIFLNQILTPGKESRNCKMLSENIDKANIVGFLLLLHARAYQTKKIHVMIYTHS